MFSYDTLVYVQGMQGNVDICRPTRVQLVAENRIMQADNYTSRLCKQIMHILFFKMYVFVHVLFSHIKLFC